jgi:hyperosmotically inducible protein
MTKVLIAAMMLAASLSAKDKSKVKDVQSVHSDSWVYGAEPSRLVKEVRHELIMLPYFGVFDDLGFKVNGGQVTLMGSVTRPTLKSDAENVVKRIDGVTEVVNDIEVLPLSPNDDRIRRATYRAIFGDSNLGTRYGFQAVPSIHIIVKNGNVRLEGVVANEMDRTIAGMRANGVPGVFGVENALTVEQKEQKER